MTTIPYPYTASLAVRLGIGVAVITAVLSGCSNPTAAPPPGPDCNTGQTLVLVVSVHQGASAPSVPAAAGCFIDSALKKAVPISIVSAEGRPRLLLKSATWTLNDGQPESSNPQAYGDDLAAARSAVLGAVTTATAASDHNDLTAAVSMAADQGHQESSSGLQILVIDNGLTDAGAVNLARPGMTAANPDEVAAFVQGHGGCPANLAGTTMTMYGAGYGVDPQPKLSSQQITAIGQIWQKTIAACGGRLELVPTPRTDPGPDTHYTVAPVPANPDAVMPPAPGDVLTFGDGGALRFRPDSAELIDPGAATAALKPFANYLSADPGRAITIAGTTSNGPTSWASYTQLAQARAEAVAGILMSTLSVPTRQIHCVGMGYIGDPPVVDPATAALNRRTRIQIGAG